MSPRPLVTFALFAYNQERFIGEAVDSVLAQTYEPLEIILSDDGSSDRTFEIMREMAGAYRGPHQVRAVQTERNLGITHHALLRCREANGEIIVVAAGDDISNPERTERLVEAFGVDASILAVTTAFDMVDELGKPLREHVTLEEFMKNKASPIYFKQTAHPYVAIQGSTAAYRRELFQLPYPDEIGGWEDQLFNFNIYAHGGRVVALNESLVKYREHGAAVVNRGPGSKSWIDLERAGVLFAERQARKLETFFWLSVHSAAPENIDTDRMAEDLANFKMKSAWPRMGVGDRIVSLLHAALSGRKDLFKWRASRLFGRFPHYFPLRWIQGRKRQSGSRR